MCNIFRVGGGTVSPIRHIISKFKNYTSTIVLCITIKLSKHTHTMLYVFRGTEQQLSRAQEDTQMPHGEEIKSCVTLADLLSSASPSPRRRHSP